MLNARLSTSARRLVAFLLCVLSASTAFADGHHPLWTVKGKQNTVYLLGSIHVLRVDERLPKVADDAYADSEKLVMEIDLDDLDAQAVQKTTLELGLLPAGQTLTGEIGPEAAAKLEAETKNLGIPSAMLAQFRPWLAAITITQLHLMKLGLDPQSGVEQRFVAKAAADHKEIIGFETVQEQLGFLANLSPTLQKQFLLQSLEDVEDTDHELDQLIAAWRNGDVAALEKFTSKALNEFPEVYRPLTIDRNRRWLGRLEEMLGEKRNYLVIVGTLHLVGKEGVIDLLGRKGYKIEQR